MYFYLPVIYGLKHLIIAMKITVNIFMYLQILNFFKFNFKDLTFFMNLNVLTAFLYFIMIII